MHQARRDRRGFALVAVLWALTGVSVITLSLALAARASTGAAYNRTRALRAGWQAEGCVSVARARLDSALGASRQPYHAWLALDKMLAAGGESRECIVRMQPVGAATDLNQIDERQLRVVLGATGLPPAKRDSLAEAILDWRDGDSQPTASGAEGPWYAAAGRLPPRNGQFASIEEIHLVRGASEISGLDSVIGVESGRLLLSRAPALVLASVEGIDAELAQAVVESRVHGDTVDIGEIALMVSPGSRAEFLTHRADVMRSVTNSPDAWMLTVTTPSGPDGRSGTTIELRLVRHGVRAAVTRRRFQ